MEEIIEPPSTENGDKKAKPDDYEVYRMWSAVSFSVMLIIVGIPLWWKTTEVYRAALPYNDIHALDPSSVLIKTDINIYSDYPHHANAIIYGLNKNFENLSIFNVEIKPFKINFQPITVESIENDTSLHPKIPGEILLVQVSSLPEGAKILVSNRRIIYFTFKADSSTLSKIILKWFFDEETLLNKVTSILSPESVTGSRETAARLRASSAYDVIFTTINSDPENLNFQWDVKHDVEGFMTPLLEQISSVSKHTIKSQWLYLMDLGESPRKDESGWYSYKFSQLPHIITPLEKKLGSGISKSPCIHMILYIASCSERPLCFLSPDELRVEGMISPQWGAVQILNPTLENCQNHTQLVFSSKDVMSVFVSQFHALLGVKEKIGEEIGRDVKVMKREGALLRWWELDSLYRLRTIEQITSASLTLQSLSKLLGEISNIVINEEVAESIKSAVSKVEKGLIMMKIGEIDEAVEYSRKAHAAAETAFSDPSLLSLLYFPDDQKYAVYIPLFLPIMIPVIMSLKRISTWISTGLSFRPQKS